MCRPCKRKKPKRYETKTAASLRLQLLQSFGGAEEGRTPGLRIANAALCQLSYCPTTEENHRKSARAVSSVRVSISSFLVNHQSDD